MRKTKIICTIGPASESEEILRQLIEAGMNVARFNFSHGTHEEHKAKFKRLVRIRREMGMPVATLMDTKGPEIRLRDFEGGKVMLEKGSSFTLTTEEVMGTAERAAISYKNLPKDVSEGGTILIDDGLIELRVNSVTETEIHCTVVNGGPVSNHKGVNVPDTDLSMPFISEQDRADIEFGCKLGYEYIAASFTRTADDILQIREILNAHNSRMKIIAKIESTQGVNNDSMMHNPRPTRAEATDVANAIYDGTTAIMLSGETASGAYPVEAVKTMSRIAEAAEKDINYRNRFRNRPAEEGADSTTAISHSTCMVAQDINAKAIVTVTMSGFTARRISKYKPTCPIVACSVSEPVACQMNLLFGVIPMNIPQEDNEEMLFEAAVMAAKQAGIAEKGDKVVLTAGVPLGETGNTNMIRVFEVF